MKGFFTFLLWTYIINLSICSDPELEEEELRAAAFMAVLNKEIEQEFNLQINSEWNYATNINEENLKKKVSREIFIGELKQELFFRMK